MLRSVPGRRIFTLALPRDDVQLVARVALAKHDVSFFVGTALEQRREDGGLLLGEICQYVKLTERKFRARLDFAQMREHNAVLGPFDGRVRVGKEPLPRQRGNDSHVLQVLGIARTQLDAAQGERLSLTDQGVVDLKHDARAGAVHVGNAPEVEDDVAGVFPGHSFDGRVAKFPRIFSHSCNCVGPVLRRKLRTANADQTAREIRCE